MALEQNSTSSEPKKKRGRKRKHVDQDLSIDEPLAVDDGVGIVEKVTLKNFMCHNNLEFMFDPHINFVIGRNGSGKSAVLSGIVLCLGGKSSVTGRNSNIKGFIQDGKDHAELSVTLRNTGVEAYRYSDYGSRIIIERRISSDGQSVYKLKGIGGKLVSSKREELNNILDSLNIQIDNPVAVLTQEASRSFLGSRDSKKKYMFFWKATQLEKVASVNEDTEKQNEESKKMLEYKEKFLPEIAREVEAWKYKQKNLNSLSEQEKRIRYLENEFLWALVIEAENSEKSLFECKEKIARFVEKSEAELQEYVKQISLNHEKKQMLEKRKKELEEMYEDGKSQLNLQKNSTEKIEQMVKKYLIDKKQNEEELTAADNGIKRLEYFLNQTKQKYQEDSAEAEEMQKRRMEEYVAHKRKLQSEEENIGIQIMAVSQKIEDMRKQQQDTVQEIHSHEYKIRNKQEELKKMEASHSQKAALYHPEMPELLKRIAHSAHLFQKLPIGPLGMYINVNDPKWTFAVEFCLGNKLSSFCCHSASDRAVMFDIMQGVQGMSVSIIVEEFLDEAYDVSQHRVRCDKYLSIYDAISCDKPVVLNCLIDAAQIERILLIENSTDAMNLMMDNPPRNCISAYTVMGDQLYPEPKYRYYSCKRNADVRYLRDCYNAQDISAKKEEIVSLRYKVGNMNIEKNNLVSLINDKRNKLQCLETKQSEMRKSLIQINEKMKEIDSTKVSYHDILIQEQELEKHRQKREELKSQLEHNKSKIKERQAEYKQQMELLKYKRIELDAKKSELGKIETQLVNYDTETFDLYVKRDTAVLAVNAEKRKLEDVQNVWNQARKAAERRIANASSVCERIATTKKSTTLRNEIEETMKVIEEHSKELNREEIAKNYVEHTKRFEAMKKEIERLKLLIKRIDNKMPKRLEKLKQMRADITQIVHHLFQLNMKARNYNGRLRFNHDEGTLEVEANAKNSRSSNVHRTALLSGGERSYVTVSLLLSLYKATEVPFHILDEYDVFMDAVNKQISMNIMLDMAESQTRNQFIFLSPLDLPSSRSRNVKVHKMPDPKRSQTQDNTQS